MLEDLDEELNAEGISLVFAEMKTPVQEKVRRYELTRTIDPDHFFDTIDEAVDAFAASWRAPRRATWSRRERGRRRRRSSARTAAIGRRRPGEPLRSARWRWPWLRSRGPGRRRRRRVRGSWCCRCSWPASIAATFTAATRRGALRLMASTVAVISWPACFVLVLTADGRRAGRARRRSRSWPPPRPRPLRAAPRPRGAQGAAGAGRRRCGPAPAACCIMNLRSGGGKAERFDLVEECRRRGIEPVVLQPGDDLLELAQERDRPAAPT